MKPNNYFERAGTVAAAGDGTVLGTQTATSVYALYEFQVQLEGTGPQTFIILGGSVPYRIYAANAGEGALRVYDAERDDQGLWRTMPGSALVINASGSAQYNYFVRGYTEPQF